MSTSRQIQPWDLEPDFEEFSYRGYPCVINRNMMGILCGYVGFGPTSMYYEQKVDELYHLHVHGGITFCGRLEHVPFIDGPKSRLWWIGFDCGHHTDLIPKMLELLGDVSRDGTYRTIEYVRNQLTNLVDQLEEDESLRYVAKAEPEWEN